MSQKDIIKAFLIVIFSCLFLSGYTQVSIMFYNRSSVPIDSIVITAARSFNMGSVEVDAGKRVFVNTDQANFHSFVPFYINVYGQKLQVRHQWQRTGFTDTLYFFDHGLTHSRLGPQRPATFKLWVENISSLKVDSVITPSNAVVQVKEMTPRSFEVELDHKKMDSDQTILFRVGERILSHDLKDSGFNDWNTFYKWVYISDDRVQMMRPQNARKFEYVIEFEMIYGEPILPVQPMSPHLIKTYREREGRLTKAVFDYAALKANPQIAVRVGKKKHLIKLKETDFDGTWDYIHFQIIGNRPRRG